MTYRTAGKVMVVLSIVLGALGVWTLGPELYLPILMHITLPPALAFVFFYRQVHWQESHIGVALMNKARAVALLYVVSFINYWLGFPAEGYLVGAMGTYLFLTISFQLHTMMKLRAQYAVDVLTGSRMEP